MAYIVVFQLIRIDNDDYHFEAIDEEAIFLTKNMDKINTWAKSVIKNEMGNDYKEWLSAYNSGEWEKDDDKYPIAECPIVAKTKKEAVEGGHILSFINKVHSSSEILHEHEKRWKITKKLIDAAININKICKKYDNCADCILSCDREEALRCMVIGKSWTTLSQPPPLKEVEA